MSDRQGIEIDYCPQCRGVWLDRGELDKIIERSAVMPVQPPVDVPQQRYREPEYPSSHMNQGHDNHHEYKQQQGHGNYGQHKKKTLLGELFDF
jgi:Zn-finger nucleic acid-binding protein